MTNRLKKWAIESYPDGKDIIIEGEPTKIILGASGVASDELIKYIVELHNNRLRSPELLENK